MIIDVAGAAAGHICTFAGAAAVAAVIIISVSKSVVETVVVAIVIAGMDKWLDE